MLKYSFEFADLITCLDVNDVTSANLLHVCFLTAQCTHRWCGAHRGGVVHTSVVWCTHLWCGAHIGGVVHTSVMWCTHRWCGAHIVDVVHTSVVWCTRQWCGHCQKRMIEN